MLINVNTFRYKNSSHKIILLMDSKDKYCLKNQDYSLLDVFDS